MFKKAEIEIHNLQFKDIIVTSEPSWGDDDIFMDGLNEDE